MSISYRRPFHNRGQLQSEIVLAKSILLPFYMDYNIKSGRNSKIRERRVFEVPRPRRIQRTAPGGTVVDALKVKVFDGGKTNPSHKYPEKRPDRAYIAIQHMKLSSFPPRNGCFRTGISV